MQLRRYWLIARRWLWLAATTVVVAALASWLIADNTTPTYEAKVRLIVGPTLDSANATFDTLRSSSQLVVTYRELVKTGTPLDNTISDLNLPYSRAQLASKLTVLSSDVTRLLTIRVVDSSPSRAALIANTLANNLAERSGQSNEPGSQLTVVESAEPATSPTAPNKPMYVVLGVAAAVLLVGGFILLVELLQNYVKTEDDLRELAHAPVLGSFTLGRRRRDADAFLSRDGQQHPVPESYQIASLKLLAGASDRGAAAGATIVVCAPTPTAATAEVSAYLAAACAQSGQETLVVDADPARRDLTRFFECDDAQGFADLVVEGEARTAGPARDIEEFSVPLRDAATVAGLHVLPAGSLARGATLPADQLRATIEALRQLPAVTVIAGPPLTSSAEALVLARHADVVVLLGVGDATRAADLREAVENLDLVRGRQTWVALVSPSLLGRVTRLTRFRGRRTALVAPSTLALEAAQPRGAAA